MTGFASFEPSMGGKWVELLKEVAPRVVSVLVLMHPGNTRTCRILACRAVGRAIVWSTNNRSAGA